MDRQEPLKALTLGWTRAQASVDRFIYSFVRSRPETDDLLQEVALAVVEGYDRYDPSRPFLGWALGIARHVVIAHLRRKYRDREVFSTQAVEHVSRAFERTDPEFNPMKDALGHCIRSVGGRSRSILNLRYGNGMDLERIADRMSMTANSAAVLLHRVRRSLRECVQRRLAGGMGTGGA